MDDVMLKKIIERTSIEAITSYGQMLEWSDAGEIMRDSGARYLRTAGSCNSVAIFSEQYYAMGKFLVPDQTGKKYTTTIIFFSVDDSSICFAVTLIEESELFLFEGLLKSLVTDGGLHLLDFLRSKIWMM